MHAQTQSSFFSLPAELRRKIYAHLGASAVHVFLRHGKVVISACVEPSGETNLYGYERKPSGKEYMNEDLTGKELAETRWMRRLRSSWGPHWKCEERAAGVSESSTEQACDNCLIYGWWTTALAVCHRMRLDIFSFMTSFAAAKVTDLETLEFLTQGDLSIDSLSPPCNIPSAMSLSSFPELDITLRLPLSFFKALEDHLDVNSSRGSNYHSPGEHATMATAPSGGQDAFPLDKWMRVWLALGRSLGLLQSLSIWLDHDDLPSWTVINERIIISHMTASLAARVRFVEKRVTINLPNLHPRHETPERHFTAGSNPLPTCITIQRRLRQRYFPRETSPGLFKVKYAADFPLLSELLELDAGFQSLEELETWERGLWESGEDVEQIIFSI